MHLAVSAPEGNPWDLWESHGTEKLLRGFHVCQLATSVGKRFPVEDFAQYPASELHGESRDRFLLSYCIVYDHFKAKMVEMP